MSYHIKLSYEGGSKALSIEPTMTLHQLGEKAQEILETKSSSLTLSTKGAVAGNGLPSSQTIEWKGNRALVQGIIPKMTVVQCSVGSGSSGDDDDKKKKNRSNDITENGEPPKKKQKVVQVVDLVSDSEEEDEDKKKAEDKLTANAKSKMESFQMPELKSLSAQHQSDDPPDPTTVESGDDGHPSTTKRTMKLWTNKQSQQKAEQAANSNQGLVSFDHLHIITTVTALQDGFYKNNRCTGLPPLITVHLVPEPTNEYDKNAIRVDLAPPPGAQDFGVKVRALQEIKAKVGYIPKPQAAVLAPWLDKKLILIERATIQTVRGQKSATVLLKGKAHPDALEMLELFFTTTTCD